MLKKFLIIGAVVILSGCSNRMLWVHQEKSMTDFYRENSQCMAMSQGVNASQIQFPGINTAFNAGFMQGFNTMNVMMAQQQKNLIYNQCMLGNGWSLMSEREYRKSRQRAFKRALQEDKERNLKEEKDRMNQQTQ